MELLRALDAAPATIVGSSAGGVLALQLAVKYPEAVAGLVLIEPAYQLAKVLDLSTVVTMLRVRLKAQPMRSPAGAYFRPDLGFDR